MSPATQMILFLKDKIDNIVSDKKFSEILTGSAWALGAQVLATSLGMVTSIIVARGYSAEILGIIAVLNSYLTLATIFTVMGTSTSILRLIPEHLAKYSPSSAFMVYRKNQHFVVGVSIVTGTLLYSGSDFVANVVFSKPNLKFYFALAAVFVVFKSLMALNTSSVRGLRLIRVFAFMQLLPSLSQLLILIPITFFFFHQSNPIFAMLASIAITAVVGAWIMDRAFKNRISPNDSSYSLPMKEILAISMPMFMTIAMTFAISQTGVIMLGVFQPEADVGYYSIAVRLASMTAFVITAINAMTAPKFSELYCNKNMDELFYIARKSTRLIFWSTAPILLFLFIAGKGLIWLLYGPSFTVAYPAMILLILGQFANSISGSTDIFMNMTGHQNILLKVKMYAAILNIVLCILLIPLYGIYGASFSFMFSLSFWNFYVLVFIKMKYGKSIGYLPFLCKGKV